MSGEMYDSYGFSDDSSSGTSTGSSSSSGTSSSGSSEPRPPASSVSTLTPSGIVPGAGLPDPGGSLIPSGSPSGGSTGGGGTIVVPGATIKT